MRQRAILKLATEKVASKIMEDSFNIHLITIGSLSLGLVAVLLSHSLILTLRVEGGPP